MSFLLTEDKIHSVYTSEQQCSWRLNSYIFKKKKRKRKTINMNYEVFSVIKQLWLLRGLNWQLNKTKWHLAPLDQSMHKLSLLNQWDSRLTCKPLQHNYWTRNILTQLNLNVIHTQWTAEKTHQNIDIQLLCVCDYLLALYTLETFVYKQLKLNLISFQSAFFPPHTARLESAPFKNVVGYESGVSKELVSQVNVTTEVFNPRPLHCSAELLWSNTRLLSWIQ